MRPVFGGFPAYGLLYSAIVLLILIPMVLISDAGLGHYPSFGLAVRVNKPATIMADADEDLLIVTVRCHECIAGPPSERDIQLNSRPVSWGDLSDALRAKLSRRGSRVVYVEGDDNLMSFGDIVRVIDIARGAWPGVPVVLLTPVLKRQLNAERATGKHQ
jgi:biopolymer transport protein ExbD